MALQTKTLTANGEKGHHKFTLTVTENSTSTTSNTSSLSFNFVLSPVSTSWNWEQWGTSISYAININGSIYSGSIPNYDGYSTVTLKSDSLTVAHNSDGSKDINITFGVIDKACQYYTCGDASSSAKMTLTKIARASSLSLSTSSVQVGNSITATISRASDNFTHTVKFYINDTYCQEFTGVATSHVYRIPTSWYFAMPSSTSCTAYCRVTTYSGTTQIGDPVTQSFTVTVPGNIIPSVGDIAFALGSIDGKVSDILVQNKNTLRIDVGACSAGYGSTIKSYTFSGPDIFAITDSTRTFATSSKAISSSGTLTYTVTVTDARGRTASKSETIVCHAWSVPTITITSAYRVKSGTDTTEDSSGEIIKFSYNIAYSSVNSTNSVDVKLYSKEKSASSYTPAGSNILTSSKNTTGTHAQGGFPSSKTYEIYLSVSDKYGGSNTSQVATVFNEGRIMNIRTGGKGIAFGKMAENDDVLDSRWPIKTDDPATTMDNLSFRGTNVSGVEDSTAGWCQQGNLTTVYYSKKDGHVTNQPATAGFLINITNHETQVHQLWATQSKGDLYHRGGNNTTSVLAENPWRKVLDTTNTLDYVVEQKTSGKTTYRKWNSGLVEMWYYEELGKMALTTSMVSGVYSNTNCNSRGASFPEDLFATGTMPMATINVYSNGYTFCQVSEVQLDKNQFVYRVWSPYSTTIDSCNISIYATGKWK